MNDSKATVSSGGVGFVGLLQVAFIVLKLTGVIKWSWLWVLAPAWMSAVFTLMLVAVILAGAVWAARLP